MADRVDTTSPRRRAILGALLALPVTGLAAVHAAAADPIIALAARYAALYGSNAPADDEQFDAWLSQIDEVETALASVVPTSMAGAVALLTVVRDSDDGVSAAGLNMVANAIAYLEARQ